MANFVPVNKEAHQNLKVAAKRDLSHVSEQHLVPISAREYAQAATSYPIALVKDPEIDRYRSIAMLGFESGENLYYEEDKWNAIYVPLSISQIPFGLGLDPEKEKTLTACIDVDSEFVGEDKENAIFDADGNETEFYKNVQERLGRLYDNEVMTEQFIEEMIKYDLLIELEMNMQLASGETKKLKGLHGIDEKKLQTLSDETVLDFHKRGLFIPIHAMLCSVGQLNRLAQLRNLSDNPAKIAGVGFSVVTEEQK